MTAPKELGGFGNEVKRVPSSLIASTSEVVQMLDAIRAGDGTFWYELFQGAVDYNKASAGKPSIECVLSDGRTQQLPEFLNVNPEATVRQVLVKNHIRSGEGLSPGNIRVLGHGGGEGTLGQHGRGLTISATASLVGNHCKDISFLSVAGGKPWRGRGEMAVVDGEEDPCFTLEYTQQGIVPTDQTVITVERPSVELMRSLRAMPRDFLLANAQYQHSEIAGDQYEYKIPNVFTMYAQRDDTVSVDPQASFFSNEEIRTFGLPDIPRDKLTQLPRVEILDDSLICKNPSDVTSNVFVDGLRLQNSYYNYAMPWSFYGFGNASNYFVKRSHDSRYVEGNPQFLIGKVLAKCNSSDVFLRILRKNINGQETVEGTIRKETFDHILPSAEDAICAAWDLLVVESGYKPEEVYVTSSRVMQQRAEAEGFSTILLGEGAYREVLRKKGKIRSAEEALGVKKASQSIGETVHVRMRTSEEHEESLLEKAVHLLALFKGRMHIDHISGKASIDLGEEAAAGFQGSVNDLPYFVGAFAREVAVLARRAGRVDVVVGDGQAGTQFEFDVSDISGGLAKVETKKGEVIARKKGLDIAIFSRGKTEDALSRFLVRLEDEVGVLIGEDGYIDLEKYQGSAASKLALMNMQLEQKRREIEKMKEDFASEERQIAIRRDQIRQGARAKIALPMSLSPNTSDMQFGSRTIQDRSWQHQEEVQEMRNEFPDLIITPRQSGKTGQLITAISSSYSVGTELEYYELSPLPFEQRRYADKAITLKRVIASGKRPFFSIVGHRPVGYFHPEGQEVSFFKLPGKNIWAASSDKQIAPGLEVYFEATDEVDISTPSQIEQEQLVNVSMLDFSWRNIISSVLRNKVLTEREKADIILGHWHKEFVYNPTKPPEFKNGDDVFLETIRGAEGNCQEAARGPLALLRAVGIPTRYLFAQLPQDGRLLLEEDGHAMIQAYIDKEWVTIEPQWGIYGYLDGKQSKSLKASYLLDRMQTERALLASELLGVPEVERERTVRAVLGMINYQKLIEKGEKIRSEDLVREYSDFFEGLSKEQIALLLQLFDTPNVFQSGTQYKRARQMRRFADNI